LGDITLHKKIQDFLEKVFIIIIFYGTFINADISKNFPAPFDLEIAYLYVFAFLGVVIFFIKLLATVLSRLLEKDRKSLISLKLQGIYLLGMSRLGAILFFFLMIPYSWAFMSENYSPLQNFNEIMKMLFLNAIVLFPIFRGIKVLEKPTIKNVIYFFLPLVMVLFGGFLSGLIGQY
jgi:hypothetical protein